MHYLKSMETTSLEMSLNTFAVACHSFLEPLSHWKHKGSDITKSVPINKKREVLE